jgi:hypothetical protein
LSIAFTFIIFSIFDGFDHQQRLFCLSYAT